LIEQYESHRGLIHSVILYIFCHILCSCHSELFISVHVQRWTVLRLYKLHDWRINCWSTVRLYSW